MAQPTTAKGHQLQILIGDGASPEVFAPKCLINAARSLNLEATTRDQRVPDCDSPGMPAWLTREKDTLSARVSGAGVLHVSDSAFFDAWFVSKDAKNIQVKENVTGGRTASGAFHLVRFDLEGADQNELVNASIELVSTGVVTFADNA